MATRGTPVGMSSRSAPSSWASRPLARSLSTTASTPTTVPSGCTATGIPPPPAATTTAPLSSNVRIVSVSRMRRGRGDGTVRRQPRPASSMIVHPRAFWRARAVASFRNDPMGFVGCLKASSAGSTTRLRDDGDDGPGETAPGEFVGQRLDEHVADRALRVGHGVVDGNRVHLGLGEFRAAQDEPDLRAVAVRDDEPPALLDQVDQMARRCGRPSRTGRGWSRARHR